MLFKSKKTLPILRLYANGHLLYDGLLKDVPLKETLILQKSILFFDDPEPCHIHRSAVRVRLTAEIQEEFKTRTDPSVPGPLLSSYTDFECIDSAILLQ